MVQGVLLALAFNLYYQAVISYPPTELTAMIKASRNEQRLNLKMKQKNVSRKLVAKVHSVLNARLQGSRNVSADTHSGSMM